jgi:hypothetical protein
MNVIQVVEAIKHKFAETGSPTQIPLLRDGSFTAKLLDDGISVSNLGNEPFLPWAALQETVCVLIRNGGRAERGDAMGEKLGGPGLSIDSIEGHVAHVVYGKRRGDSVFRRITPIACILIWAGICEAAPNELILRAYA